MYAALLDSALKHQFYESPLCDIQSGVLTQGTLGAEQKAILREIVLKGSEPRKERHRALAVSI